MFSFFSKKKFLVDFLNRSIDIHNHILPGIDDGSKSIDASLKLIEGFSKYGVKRFICTPHIMHNFYENTPETISKSLEEVRRALNKRKLDEIEVFIGAEHMIDSNFESKLANANNSVIPILENHLLIEMSYLQPSINFESSIKKIQQKELFPLLAHPERYVYLHQDFKKYDYYKSQGVRFQLNMLSLSNYYGKEVKRIALRLLENNMYDFIGSDVHNMNQFEQLGKIVVHPKYIKILQELIDAPNHLNIN